MYDLPAYVWAIVLVGVIGIPAVTCLVLHQGALRAGLRRRAAAVTATVAAALLGGWLLVSSALADAGAYRADPDTLGPWLPLALVGVLIALLVATRIPVVSRILAAPGTPARLAMPQTLRVVGVAFLIAMALGKVPAVFALPAGLGDIAVGVAAPFVARALAGGAGRRGAVWFNVLGLADLVVAVSIGFLAGLGPTQLIDVSPTTEALTLLPLVLVPTVAVPVAIALHLVSLRRLAIAGRQPATSSPPVPAAS